MRNVNFRPLLTDRGHFTRCQGILYPVILSFSFPPIIMTSSTQKVPVLLIPAAAQTKGSPGSVPPPAEINDTCLSRKGVPMKLIVNQDLQIPETEITIRCACMDSRLERLINQIRQYAFSLTGYQEDKEYQLPLDQIFFIDSVDGKTFLYLEKEVYTCRDTLTSLEERLSCTSFTRISKSCLVNTSFLKSVRPLYNHRLEAVLQNGEKLIITRNYIEPLKEKLKGANL